MTLWLSIFALLVLLSALEVATDDGTSRRLFPLAAIFFIIFAGLRGDGVGFDYDTYKDLFDDTVAGRAVFIEPAYRWLMQAIDATGGGFQTLLLVMATLAVGTKSWFIHRWAPYVYTGLMVYFTTSMPITELGQIRYGLAVAMALVAFHSLATGHRWRALAITLVATLFHFSTLIVFPALIVANRRLSGRAMAVTLMAAAVFYFISINDVLIFVSRFIPVPYIQEKVGFYTYAVESFGRPLGLNISLALRLLVLWLAWRYRDALAEVLPASRVFIGAYFYGVVLYMILNSNAEFATRGSGYFKILEVALLPALVSIGRTVSDRFLIWAAIAAYGLYSIVKILGDDFGADAFLHYHNVLF